MRASQPRRRRIVGVFTTLGTLMAAAAVAAPAAQAWSNETVRYAYVDTDNCRVTQGTLNVNEVHPNGCTMYDSYDGTFFAKDADGRAAKIELHTPNGLVGKLEFHPYGEKLWLYDTKADGDTFYVQINDGRPIKASSAPRPIDYGFGERRSVKIEVWDSIRNGLPYNLITTKYAVA